MALPPCHYAFQFFVHGDGKHLSVSVTMRSADIFLGLPFNISAYALLLSMVAQVMGKVAYEVVFNICDLHLYANHVEQAKELISRYPCKKEPVQLSLNPEITDIDDFTIYDIKLLNYNPLPKIESPVAV
jgi:thymidylate synthase